MSSGAKVSAPIELELLDAFLEHIPDCVYFKDLDSRFVRVSRSLAIHFGLSDPAQALNKTDSDIFSSEHSERALADEREIIRTGQPVIGKEEKETWPDGHETWAATTKVALRNREGQIIGTMGISRDITKLRRDEQELQKYSEKAKAIRDLAQAMQEVTVKGNFAEQVSIRGNDEIAQLGVQFNTMLRELHQQDIRRKDAEAKLKYQAVTDELTGLPNRRLFSDRLSQALATAKRKRDVLALLYIDLDGFKLVNDSLGHTVGDLLLGQVAERLRSRIRQSDTLARLGGDEFSMVLTSLNEKNEAGLVANNLLEVLVRPFLIENQEITISASIGISAFPANGADAADLLQQADSAMYAAKRNGKNQVMCFTPEIGSSVRERLSLETQFRGAISRGEILVHYQPEFNLESNQLIRFEALARWTHPILGAIPPSKFIPVAEESGLIIPFGAYVMERACVEAVKWQAISDHPIQVAVNVSSLQFTRDGFVTEVADILRRTGLDPKLLQIELTESVMLAGADKAAKVMKELRALGIGIAIDDFGTGYSCLSYLPRLPFNCLKIDRSFVKELELRPETKAMVKSLITLAHNLNMRVIVEGIETRQQLEIVKDMTANEVQGFFLGVPTADPQLEIRLRQNSADPLPKKRC